MPATTYDVDARIVRPGVSEIAAKQSSIRFDSSPRLGDELAGPAELLCVAKHGTVYSTLAAACDISGEILVVPPG